jgi:hypothetical protein
MSTHSCFSSGVNICGTLLHSCISSQDLQLLLAAASIKCPFCLLIHNEGHSDSLQLAHQHNYSKPHQLQCSASSNVTQVYGELLKLSIKNTCSPRSNSIDGHKSLSSNNFHLIENVDWGHVSAVRNSYHCKLLLCIDVLMLHSATCRA